MDRRSKFKIRAVILIVGIILGTELFFMVDFVKKEQNSLDRQKKEMIVIHPEYEKEFTDTFRFYEKERINHRITMGILLIVSEALCSFFIYYYVKKYVREEHLKNKLNMEKLLNQLKQFRQGEYMCEMLHFEVYDNEKTDATWKWIEDSLRELGYYFESLKRQLEVEENSTKALITDISHQLKTPLASLRMSYELAHEQGLTEHERYEFLGKERQEIDKLEVLLDELVKLSRLESRMIQVKKEPSSLSKTIIEAVNQISMKANKKNIELSVTMDEDIMIPHDRKWTVESIVNILDNAIKYSDESANVELRVKRLQSVVMIEIEDEGIGIAQDEVHKIFQRFYRGRDASRKVAEGAGVGLYLARKIIEDQEGSISVKTKRKGCIFRIILPL